MDTLATRQIKKSKSLAGQRPSVLAQPPPPTLQERIALNRSLGFADPPSHVFALGKDECAAVWWPEPEHEPVDIITSWEVHRYRKDKTKPGKDIWHHKGYVEYPPMLKAQAIVNDLTNDYEYRFTVKAVNAKGGGIESEPSNAVMVEKPLPTGWFRFQDMATKHHYYANVRLNKSTWERPETDPWFLDETILLNFEAREIDALKALYTEDMAHFGHITVDQFMDVLREIGEHCSKSWIAQLFRGYAGTDHSITTWQHFMEIVNHIKKYRTTPVSLNPFRRLILCLQRKQVGALLQPKREKMGDWVVEYSDLAERNFYRNVKTGESYWSMPPQVKFYIPPRLEDKLLLAFDYGDLEEFQQYFSLLDVDNSGDLSGREVRVLLKALDINISELKFNQLLQTVDLNGNGTIEFDEYCWMMLQIFRKDNGSFWTEIRARNKAISASNKEKAAAGGVPVVDRNDYSGGAADFSAADPSTGSLENSLFGDKAWGNKLSYNRLRNTLNAMQSFAAAAGGVRRNSMSKRHSQIFSSFRRLSVGSGTSRQNSFVGTSEAPETAVYGRKSSLLSWLPFASSSQAAARKPREVSKLNAVLSQYDEKLEEEKLTTVHSVPPSPAASPLYPAASFRRKSRGVSADIHDAGVKRDEDLNTTGSVAGTTGSVFGGSPAVNNRKGRRVSFSKSNVKVVVSSDYEVHVNDTFEMNEEVPIAVTKPPPPALIQSAPANITPSAPLIRDIPREIAMLKAAHRHSVLSASGQDPNAQKRSAPPVPIDGSPGGRDIRKEIANLKAAGCRSSTYSVANSVHTVNSSDSVSTLGADAAAGENGRVRTYSESSAMSIPEVRERRSSSAASVSELRERRRSSSGASRVSASNSTANTKKSALKKTHPRGKPRHDEDLSDDSDEDDPDNYFDENDDEEETRSIGGSILKKISSFAMLSVGSGEEEERRKSNPNIHPKHCMCGCRAY